MWQEQEGWAPEEEYEVIGDRKTGAVGAPARARAARTEAWEPRCGAKKTAPLFDALSFFVGMQFLCSPTATTATTAVCFHIIGHLETMHD